MSAERSPERGPDPDHPYAPELDSERQAWFEVMDLVGSLTPAECLEAGYQRDPDWNVRDLVAHLGTWLAKAGTQFEQMSSGTYEGHAVDVEALNAALLAAMAGESWDIAWVQANAGRTRMVEEWYALQDRSDEVSWWVGKTAGDHYREHLERLRAWVAELVDRRGA
jgi:hypothetical protein